MMDALARLARSAGMSLALAGAWVACSGGPGDVPSPSPSSGADGGTSTDGGVTADGSTADGSANDGAPADTCPLPESADLTRCQVDDDCAIVEGGCYCGQQPATGYAKSAAAAAAACEKKAADECALGCANFPGRIAQDGKSDVDGGTIAVRCEKSSAAADGTCKTYVP